MPLLLAVATFLAVAPALRPGGGAHEAAAATPPISTDRVVVPMVFPHVGKTSYTDTYLVCRSGCTRKHLGQDLMSPRMTKVVATFDGYISYLKRETYVGGGNYLSLRGDNGWTTNYIHLNNDSPGTDDGKGTGCCAIMPGLRVGSRVFAGQQIGWSGDSGNAESTAPHTHFELRRGDAWAGTVYDPKPSLDAARRLSWPLTSGPHPDGTLISRGVGYPVYQLVRGQRRKVVGGVGRSYGWTADDVVYVQRSEVFWYPYAGRLPLRDGLVYRAPDGKLWSVAGGRRVAVSGTTLAKMRITAAQVRPTDLDSLNSTPLAADQTPPATPYREGTLVRRSSYKSIFLISRGARHWVPNSATMRTWRWAAEDIVVLPDDAFSRPDAPPVGSPVELRPGSLLITDGRLWFVHGSVRRYIRPLVRNRYGWSRVVPVSVSAAHAGRVPVGPALP